MESRPRSKSRHFTREHFDNSGQLIGDGIIDHRGNARFEPYLGDIQIQRMNVDGDITAGTGTNLYLRKSVFSGGEISLRGSLESEESIEAIYGIFVDEGLKAWGDIKASSINTSKILRSFGSIFSKHAIIVKGDILVSQDLNSGSDVVVVGETSVGRNIGAIGCFQSAFDVKCLGNLKAKEIQIKGNLLVKLGLEVLEKTKVFGNMKVGGNIIVPVKLEVGGDIEHIGYMQCPIVVCNGRVTIGELV